MDHQLKAPPDPGERSTVRGGSSATLSRRLELNRLAMGMCPDARRAELAPFSDHLRRFDAPLRILDLGCGNGFLTRHIARAFPKHSVVGVDRQRDVATRFV